MNGENYETYEMNANGESSVKNDMIVIVKKRFLLFLIPAFSLTY